MKFLARLSSSAFPGAETEAVGVADVAEVDGVIVDVWRTLGPPPEGAPPIPCATGTWLADGKVVGMDDEEAESGGAPKRAAASIASCSRAQPRRRVRMRGGAARAGGGSNMRRNLSPTRPSATALTRTNSCAKGAGQPAICGTKARKLRTSGVRLSTWCASTRRCSCAARCRIRRRSCRTHSSSGVRGQPLSTDRRAFASLLLLLAPPLRVSGWSQSTTAGSSVAGSNSLSLKAPASSPPGPQRPSSAHAQLSPGTSPPPASPFGSPELPLTVASLEGSVAVGVAAAAGVVAAVAIDVGSEFSPAGAELELRPARPSGARN
mmetsp:Transcript_29573/g.77843  ORF Transcript_29573/g.77843 Transcript_29573/m.77843 type:complete len:321 (+) Transcript_29573:4013-4975(+)